MLGIYVAGDSGAYLNPAITLANCVFRGLPWRRFPMYFLAQFLGGFVAAGVLYANYVNAINNYEGHGKRTVPPAPTATAGIFCTYPQAFMTKASMFFSEFIASSLLMLVIFALKDDTHNGVSKVSPAPVGLLSHLNRTQIDCVTGRWQLVPPRSLLPHIRSRCLLRLGKYVSAVPIQP